MEVKIKVFVLLFERIFLEYNKFKVFVGSDEGDVDLEVKVEEFIFLRKFVSLFLIFYYWREFVDNNLNFLYIIFLNYERNI